MHQSTHYHCDAIALAVINDGATYERRKQVTSAWVHKTWSDDFCMLQFFALCARESKKPHYEGMSFTRDQLWCAAGQVHDYMLNHYAESNNGADWS